MSRGYHLMTQTKRRQPLEKGFCRRFPCIVSSQPGRNCWLFAGVYWEIKFYAQETL